MTEAEIIARTLWAEDRSGGSDGMMPIAAVILNRASRPGWWGRDVIGVCLCAGQFDGWNWRDPNFRPMLTAGESDPSYTLATTCAQAALNGAAPDVNGATHYYAKSMKVPPEWARNQTPVFETDHHLFFKVGLGA